MLGLNLSTKPLDEKIRWAFRLYDISQDGLIQRAEITQVRGETGFKHQAHGRINKAFSVLGLLLKGKS